MTYDLRKELESGEGFHIFQSMIPDTLIDNFNKTIGDLYPVRASSSNKVYAEREAVHELEDIAVWWSQDLSNTKEVLAIRKHIDPIIYENFDNLDFYVSDAVFIKAGSKWVNPHVDTPHRFAEWNTDKRLLGIQCIISLSNLTEENGSTGVVPYSQKRDFDINKCYSGTYDRWFMHNVKQYEMPKGTVLLYNCRLLHSSMPNNGQYERPALLINYLDRSIMSQVTKVDNVWASNESP